MTHDILISIDIGLSGGIAFFEVEEITHPSLGLLSLHPMPASKKKTKSGMIRNILDLDILLHLLEIPKIHGDKALVIYEDVHSFPGQGVVSVGTLLWQRGVIQGMTKALGYDELAVSPKGWQKYFDMIPPKDLKGKSATQTKTLRKKWLKDNSLVIARGKFPEWSEKFDNNAHGLSDAVLIGLWYLNCR